MDYKSLEILDLSEAGQLEEEDCRALDRVSLSTRIEYDNFIGKLIEINQLESKNLFLSVSCRNTLVSRILYNFCCLSLIEERLKTNKTPDVIVVDHPEMKSAVRSLLKKFEISNIKIQALRKKKSPTLTLASNILKSLYVTFISFSLSKIFVTRKKPDEAIVLVDTFMFKESIDEEGNFNDRYYTGHEKFLDKKSQENIWYTPTLFGLKTPSDYFYLFKNIHKLKKNFFIKESWLTLPDYFMSIYESVVIPKEIKIFPEFRKVDVSELLRQEINKDRGSLSLFRALCNYRFFSRLSSEGVKINSVVNWFENHVNDRALNLSIKKNFKDAIIKGYQGFMLINYYATYEPTSYEYDLGTIPHEINVMNGYSKKIINNICPKLKVNISPAFRFDHLINIKDKRSPHKKVIFIPFPGEGMTSSGVSLVKSCLSVISDFQEDIELYVKPHPSFPAPLLKKYDKTMIDIDIRYTERSTSSMYEISDLVVSTGSVACAEALSLGIPIAMNGKFSEITMNPLPSGFMEDMWTIFYNKQELREFMSFAFNLKRREVAIESLFYPHTRDGARSLFSFPDS